MCIFFFLYSFIFCLFLLITCRIKCNAIMEVVMLIAKKF